MVGAGVARRDANALGTMTYGINQTHDAALKSWVESANTPGADFPIQNLPFGVFRRAGSDEPPRIGVGIGDRILDVRGCVEAQLLAPPPDVAEACRAPSLNALMALGRRAWSPLRARLSELLRRESHSVWAGTPLADRLLVPMADAEMLLPAQVGDYTDFYASIYHATALGSIFRPDNPLLPNYKYVPIAYHGRSSSLVVSGTAVRRPTGQVLNEQTGRPEVRPARLLDYELEVGFFAGPGNALGQPVGIADAGEHIFGVCLVNDWSARDIQKWEYQPLGPFLGKNFATTVSPWVVTMEALAPFRCAAFERAEGDPRPLPYLHDETDREAGGLDLVLEAAILSEDMRRRNLPAQRVSCGNARYLYWTPAQMFTHHASNGCNLRPGDLLASGTVSGPDAGARGCLIELTQRGTQPLELASGEQRRFLEDGDEVILRGYCRRDGFAAIGLGECRGRILPAGPEPADR